MANHEQNHSGVQKGPFVPRPSSSMGVFTETGEGKYPENVLVTYLLGLKALHSPRRGGACCSLGAGSGVACQHPLPERDARSMPSPAWHPTVHCTISLHPRTFLPYELEACYSCNSFCSSTCMDVSRYFLDSSRSMLHWDKLAKSYWFLRS